MDARTLRSEFLGFMQAHGHARLASASLIPADDPSVLFTSAGMQPLVPYLLGAPHPLGRRLTSVQKCLRTDDIAEVGDAMHLTLFEMLGNWSLGDYGREEAIVQAHTFVTGHLGLDDRRLVVTCFAGDAGAPRDEAAAAAWRAVGMAPERIAFLPKAHNWWGPVGAGGPCGPDTELFFDLNPTGPAAATPASDPERFVEIWNLVFMEYDLQADGRLQPLLRLCIDTGMGLERTAAVVQGRASVYDTELFRPLIEAIRGLAAGGTERVSDPPPEALFAERVIADHVRAATFVLAEGIVPGNTEQPYVARRLIRRAVRYGQELGIAGRFVAPLARVVIETLTDAYPELAERAAGIQAALDDEEARFDCTLRRGRAEFERVAAAALEGGVATLPGPAAFRLYDTYGFPVELTQELAQQRGLVVDRAGYGRAVREHQERSRQGAEGRFRGGLVERRDETTRLHTATHLLGEALRRVLGPHVVQRGSNITAERLRFDLTHPAKLTDEELRRVEELVNAQIVADLPVTYAEMSVEEALAAGAVGAFADRYAERVQVYAIGEFSLEICGGPHAAGTGALGRLRIVKEEAVSAGVRRIRAVLDAS